MYRKHRLTRNERAMTELRSIATQPAFDWLEQLNYHTECIADIMAEIHGGDYRSAINHETCLVMIGRVWVQPPHR